MRERLLVQGHIASAEGIYQVARDTGFAEVRRLLGQIFKFTADGPQWREEVLLDRPFELNDVSQMPIAHILRGQLLGWPPETLRELAPNA